MSREYPKTRFATRLTHRSGILELMDDLGEAMSTGRDRLLMMGGGNPGHIPDVQALWRRRLSDLLASPDTLDSLLADYDQPAGSPRFREAVAGFLAREFGWKIGPENVAITNGGQTAFFCLLNRFAGEMADGSTRRILLPLVPEYIGYADQSVGDPFYVGRHPLIEPLEHHCFKYRVDFEKLEIDETIGAMVVSRPTNPSSNVLTDSEVGHLSELARSNGIPLLIDNAYGAPFPGVIFEPVQPVWDDHIILTLSLSKLGLPGTRTGIVIAREDIAAEVAAMTAIISLANNNIGQALTLPLLESGEILDLVDQSIRPFYAAKSRTALDLLHEHLPNSLPWKAHKSEGAFFLWLWFEDLPITTMELYHRLKARQALVVPGEYFFFGVDSESWRHPHECLRLSYTQKEETLRAGIRILAEEVKRAYTQS